MRIGIGRSQIELLGKGNRRLVGRNRNLEFVLEGLVLGRWRLGDLFGGGDIYVLYSRTENGGKIVRLSALR